MGSKVTIIAAAGPTHLAIRKADGKVYARNPTFGGDRPITDVAGVTDQDKMRIALITKWGFERVLDKDGKDLPEVADGANVVLELRTLPDGEEVYQVKATGLLALWRLLGRPFRRTR
jgi:hypothetical protein